jgi:flagellar hook-associated protein 1 FlgK
MTQGILSIGASALNAAYIALQTTGNNIANANTPGYSREIVSFMPQLSTSLGGMYLGTGVAVSSISRVYSDFLGQQTNLAQALASQADTAATMTGQINSMFSDSSTGIGSSIDNFFTQLQALSSDASSAATQQTTLSSAQQMASTFNGYYAQLQSLSQSTQQQIGEQIQTVNTTVSQIASLNSQIQLATASGQEPNSLLDQRDQDILTLNQSIGVATTTQSNGTVDIYLANGQPLLVGTQTYNLTMGHDPTNPQNLIVGTSNGNAIAALQPDNTGGGAIGALLQFQNQTIPGVENQIGQLAVTLSTEMNAVQTQGTDANGNAGTNFFSTPTIGVTAATTNSDLNSITLNASYTDVTQLQAANYQLSFNGGNYAVVNESTGATVASGAYAAGTPITFDGVSLSLTNSAGQPATPANGDIFNISPVQAGAGNISVALSSGSQIASGSPLEASVPSSNQGSLAVSDLTLQPLTLSGTNPNLLQTVTLNFISPTQYTYTSGGTTSAVQTYTAGQPIDVNGWSLTLTGTPAAGDSATVSASGSGSGDNRNAVQMTQLQGLGIVGGATLDQAYSNVVASVGTIASTAQTDQTSKDAILTNATTSESSVSGVNLDQEAANLMQYQQQYQAAAQMIQTSNAIYTTLLSAVDSSV